MSATLYLPQKAPQEVQLEKTALANAVGGIPQQVPGLLGCAPGLVDVLASGPGYVVYSVFDSEGLVNEAAMAAVAEVSGVLFDSEDEDAILQGPVLIVSAGQV